MIIPKLSPNTSAEELDALLEQARSASKLLRSLSHETRLLILCLLTENEMTVSEIEEIVRLPQANVSQQLARLRQDGLVVTRREGRLIYYKIADKDVSSVVESLYEIFCEPVRPGKRK